ncbi:MAG: hypothetical protein MUO40_01080 [Anaerolineaceae bacterium]|nr:hypothetical protein [Anaerolineaceae bacterium]
MKIRSILVMSLILLSLSACKSVPLPPTEIPLETLARRAMMDYFADLNNAEYESAVSNYGGSYEILQGFTPDLDPQDKAALFQAGCERNGLACMQLMTAKLTSQADPLTFVYKVSYRGANNLEFILGPCCGAT